jgi:hypothetical protein
MYRQGLGDCHLITFGAGRDARHILIDCGTLGATTTGVKLAEVVKDIASRTKGHLNLVIATHEHHDHLSGFGSLGSAFEKFEVDNVWLAWTENPADPMAQQIAKNKEDLGTALKAASTMLMNSTQEGSKARGSAIESLLGFYGDALGAKFSKSVNDAMNFVRKDLTVPATFKNPGDGPLEESWLPGFRFYILGPPRSVEALNDTGEKGSSELYGISAGLLHATRFHMAGAQFDQYASADPDAREGFERELPFDARFRFENVDSRVQEWFTSSYFDRQNDWRRIDSDWLHVASDLALQLDSSTNNTSLAFAIERVSDGKVLLFTADAQQGSWLSWHDPKMQWTVKNKAGKKEIVSAAELLSRTVFYKVGHHASHNATAKAKGLEMMKSNELVAFIPVDRAVALTRNPPGSWRMPARPLYLRLLQRCTGRVLRSDLGWADDSKNAKNRKAEREFDNMATLQDWKKWKAEQTAATHIKVDDLFIQYTLM